MDYLTANEAKAFLKEVRETLSQKNVTFAQIIELRNKYDEHSFEYLQQDQDSSVYKKLKDYADLVDAIQTNNIAKAKEIAGRPSISAYHAKLVRMFGYRQVYSELKSFAEIQTVTTPQTDAGGSFQTKPVESRKNFTCGICGSDMFFYSQQELDAHIRKHDR